MNDKQKLMFLWKNLGEDPKFDRKDRNIVHTNSKIYTFNLDHELIEVKNK